ncbi:MAG: DUF4160 domain-containing protein [Selenomonadaceae bacterium]|nr:DUF4160 domain-containing protein [Selenomonadaceae bacterium]
MPEIMTILGYKIYFWVNEGIPLEPIHIHVSRTYHANATKLWLTSKGEFVVAKNTDKIPQKDLRKIKKILKVIKKDVIIAWKNKFGEIEYIDNVRNI